MVRNLPFEGVGAPRLYTGKRIIGAQTSKSIPPHPPRIVPGIVIAVIITTVVVSVW